MQTRGPIRHAIDSLARQEIPESTDLWPRILKRIHPSFPPADPVRPIRRSMILPILFGSMLATAFFVLVHIPLQSNLRVGSTASEIRTASPQPRGPQAITPNNVILILAANPHGRWMHPPTVEPPQAQIPLSDIPLAEYTEVR